MSDDTTRPTTPDVVRQSRILLSAHVDLLNMTIRISSFGEATFREETLTNTLSDPVRSVTTMMSMCVGQSIATLLLLTEKQGMHIRDCFPITRSITEGLINAAYVLAGGDDLANQAIRHAAQKHRRDMEQTFELNSHKIQVTRTDLPDLNKSPELAAAIEEFSSKKGRGQPWTRDGIIARIQKIEDAFGCRCAVPLLAAYGMVYDDASEIVHGTYYGAELFHCGLKAGGKEGQYGAEAFQEITYNQTETLITATYFALECYLRTFAKSQNFSAMIVALDGLSGVFRDIIFPKQQDDSQSHGPRPE